MPGTNALKELQAYATTGTWIPCGSRASVFPTALGLMGRRHGVRGIDDYAESTRSFSAGGPPAELLPSWEDRRSPTPRRCPARPGPARRFDWPSGGRSEEHTSELQSLTNLVCRLLLEKKNTLTPHAS